MIRTDFLAGQGLGNQLWVYAACRGIASNLQIPFKIGGLEYFKGKGFLELDTESEDILDFDNQKLLKSDFRIFRERQFFDADLKYFASDYDSRVEHLSCNTYLAGLFQSESYLYGRKAELGHWIRLSDEMKNKSAQFADFCVINIRGGEYKRHKNLILPKSYWELAMKNVRDRTGMDRFLMVTDDRAYAKALFPNLPVLEGGIAECYAALYGASCLVVSNSSFSYFPIKTRVDKPYVIAPYLWSRPNNPFLRWAAPANLYKDWEWQDQAGSLHSYDECMPLREKTLETYLEEYSISVSATSLKPNGLLGKIPSGFKKTIKRILSKGFPTRFG